MLRVAYAALIGMVLAIAVSTTHPVAQDPAQPATAGQGRQGGRGQAGRGRGPNFPQQQRALADPAVLARGKGLYEANCAACHGIDLRGGQQGGPNLLRSQIVLSDKSGELVLPIVQNGRPNPPAGAPPMPPFSLPPDDIKAIAEYLHSVLARAGNQGRPPEGEIVAPQRVLVGDAAAGQAYFASKCASCHSVTGDLKGLAARASDPRDLQNRWVSGGGGGRGGRGGGGGPGTNEDDPAQQQRAATIIVTPASGTPVEGRLVRIDDFIVTLVQKDGTRRTFARKGTDPKVEIRDSADAHRALVPALADKDMHNVTAYLWSLR
jgi:cytochrome c oxidase cbb3-type subunit 3